MANLIPTSTFDGIVQQTKELESLLTTNPEMERRLRAAVNRALIRAREQLVILARNSIERDNHSIYRAIGKLVYKQLLGGNLNLYVRGSRSGSSSQGVSRKLRQGQVGGNRMPRSKRTEALQSYSGEDRGFILFFINKGTKEREHKSGRRTGHISPRNFMNPSVIDIAVVELAEYIDEEYRKMTSNG